MSVLDLVIFYLVIWLIGSVLVICDMVSQSRCPKKTTERKWEKKLW